VTIKDELHRVSAERLVRTSCLPALLALWLATCPAAALQAQPNENGLDWRRLERGDILVTQASNESGTPGLRCFLLVSGDKARLFSQIRDPSFFKETYRSIKGMRVLRQRPHGEDIEYVIDAVLRTVRYTATRTVDDENFEVTWHRLAGDLRDISGLWAVKDSPYPGKCLVVYESYVDPGGGINVEAYAAFARLQARSNLARLRAALEKQQQ
jgi:hypothetical protein